MLLFWLMRYASSFASHKNRHNICIQIAKAAVIVDSLRLFYVVDCCWFVCFFFLFAVSLLLLSFTLIGRMMCLLLHYFSDFLSTFIRCLHISIYTKAVREQTTKSTHQSFITDNMSRVQCALSQNTGFRFLSLKSGRFSLSFSLSLSLPFAHTPSVSRLTFS